MSDYFVGAMKGVILSINPQARIVDITHEIAPQDIFAAAFTLLAVYESFPPGTVHVAVVDPGVGSSRRPIIAVAGRQFFVGPDNGIFSYILDHEPDVRVFHLTKEEYFRQPVSTTFHGRDVFAPVAAALSSGVKPEKLGERIDDPVPLPALGVSQLRKGKLRGRILHIDHFGNCITNLTQRDLPSEWLEGSVRLTINRRVIKSFRRCFSDETENGDGLFAIWGSAGFLEIAAMNQSAAELLNARRGQPVVVSASNKTNKPRYNLIRNRER